MTLDVTAATDPELGSGTVARSRADRLRALRGPTAVGAAVAACSAFVFVVDPNQPGHYPLCPFRALTGLDCPGCGALRGTHDLMHGDVAGALDHNLLLAFVLPGLLVAWVLWVRRAWTGRAIKHRVPRAAWFVVLALVVAFWIARDVPGMPFLPSS